MWGSTLCALGAITLAWGMNDEAVVEGEWTVNAVFTCPDADKYPYPLTVTKSMMNRTTDCYDLTMDLPEEINALSHGAHLEMCKKVDGGCKLQYTQTPASFCDIINQYANNNFQAALSNVGVENLDCPIPKGEWTLKRFPFNYKELPAISIPGDFIVTVFLMKGEQKCMCLMLDCSFIPID